MNDKQEINKQQTKFLTNNKHLLTKVETNKKESESKQTTKKSKIETDEQTTQKQQMSNKPSIVKVFRNKQTAKR